MTRHPIRSALGARLRPWLPALQFAVGVACVGAVVRLVDVEAVGRILAGVRPGPFALALLAVQVQILVAALRWRFTAQRLGQALPLRRAVAEYYLASLLNQVLPGGIAGDAVRVLRSARSDGGERQTRRAAEAVVMERLSGQVVLMAAALAGVVAAPFVYGRALPGGAALLAPSAALCLAALALCLARGRATRFLAAYRPMLAAVFLRRGACLVQLATSLAVVGGYLAAFAFAAAAVGAPLDAPAAVLLVPLVLLSMLLPVSVGGWGLREAAAGAILPLAGLAPQEAVAASLVYGLASLAGAAPGLLVLLGLALARRPNGRAGA